jgi:amino acid adenylation domain-containing protein
MQTLDAGMEAVAQPAVIQGFRLSAQQARLWRLRREGGPYRVRCALRVQGAGEAALWDALAAVVERHEILRTSFQFLPGMNAPLQVIGEPEIRRGAVRDLPGPDTARDAARDAVADLLREPPESAGHGLAASLARLGPDDLVLVLDLDPLCADEPSLALLAAEIGRALAGGEPGEVAMQYADYAEWQHDLLGSDEAREEAAGWRKAELAAAGAPPLPWEETAGEGFDPRAVRLELERTDTPFLLACWAALLARLTGEPRVALAVAADGRDYEELKEAIGPFSRSLPVVLELPPATRFDRLLAAVREAVEEAEARQDSFSWEGALFPAYAFLAERAAAERAAPETAAGGVRVSLAGRSVCAERFRAQFVRLSGEEGLELRCDASRIRPEDARRLARSLETLAAGALARPDSPVGDLEILPEPERRRLLADLNDTADDLPGAGLLHGPFERQAAATPGRTALRFEGGTMTYAELDRSAGRLARRLRGLGAGPEVPVAICVERSAEMVIGLLAILKAGGAYVPLDPEHPAERRASILAEVRPPVVLTQRRLAGTVHTDAPVLCLDEPPGEGAEDPAAAVDAVAPENLAYILYTSGSTGRPKGVMVPHRAISNRVLWMQRDYPVGEGDRVLQKTPYGFDASIWEIFLPLSTGAELVLARPGGHQDMAYLADAIVSGGITTFQLVPSLLRAFLEEPGAARCEGLRRMFCGGEELAADLAARFASLLPEAALHNLYGPTEAAIDATSWPCREGVGPRAAPIGRPIANVRVYLVDARLHPVPAGVPGELCIGGTGLARGYFGRPDQTAERFVPDPFGPAGSRLYRTGDLARHRPGGELEYLGRVDRQVKVRGVRIEPREIEALLREHPAVRDAVVAPRGEGADLRLIAWAVPRGRDGFEARALRDFLRGRLPEAMVPAAVVPLPALPLTPNGKVDFAALPDPAAAAGLERGYAAPRSETEEMLAALWAEVLKTGRVGVHDNFFELGGHSLSATQLISRIRKGLGVDLAVHQLFDAPTVAGLARELEAAVRGAGPSLPPVERAPREEAMPLSFAQQRLWFFERLRPGTPVFNIIVAFRLRGRLDVPILSRAFDEVVRRHETLRTTFPDRRGLPVQVVGEPYPLPMPVVDLRALPEAAREAETMRRIAAEGYRPFDLGRGPLLRVLLLRLGPEEHAVPFTVHHIVSDAWSSGVLTREIAALYRAFSAGEPPLLPELPVQYADFAVWQHRWLAGEALAAQTEWWRRRLERAPALLALPADRPRPERPSYRGVTRPVELPRRLGDDLQEIGRRHGATLFMTVLAAFQVLLRHYTGQNDLVVGTDVANRNRLETEGLIGFFINQLVLRTDLSGDPSFPELLARVREVTLGAYAHQDTPFEHLVDALKVPRTLAHAPLFQVKFFLENTPPGDLDLPGLTLSPIEFETDVAKLDLTLALWQRANGLSGWINYSTDLFDGPRIERLLGHFRALLEAVAARPESRLSELEETVAELEKKERDMEKKEMQKLSFSKFKAVAPKAVALPGEEVVEKTFLAPGQELPLVVQPRVPDVDLADWAQANRESLEADLLKYGAILFRGFGIDTPEALERFAGTLCPDLFNENGEHPRESVSGNVYTPVFYPQDQQLLWHNENSFNWSWPRKIFFACARPADEGGETPIVDSRRVYREMDPQVRELFETRGVAYQRNYAEGLGLPWQTVFQTSDPAEVESEARETRTELDWRDGGRLRTRAPRPGVIRHPVTGEVSWFNQAQHWHVSCLDSETRDSMRALFADQDLPRQCYYGDGTPIEDAHMEAVLDVYRRLEVAFPWRRGDVVMLDNVLTAHGRNRFQGQRKILVAMGQMTNYGEV